MTRSVAIAAIAVLGCAAPRMKGEAAPATDLRTRGAAPLRAGTARVDVTPPPGPSTFGHGPDARVAEGYWTRLYCRAFVLETDPADRLAVVPCDLHSISTLLHREVAERVRAIVPASRLLITATHTHAGPAHYFESSAYSGITSSRRPGFDAAMVEFLAARIAAAIESAYARLQPAAARWVHTEAWKLTRNRSLEAFRANPEPLPVAPPAGLDLSDEEAAVDPALHVLQLESVDRGDGTRQLPIGWIVLFAMHPTVIGSRNRLFGADAFGATSRLLEAELRRTWQHRCASRKLPACRDLPGADPLVAVVNTNEGDISPIWVTGTREEAIRVGRELAERSWVTHPPDPGEGTAGADPSAFRAAIALDSRYLESALPGAKLDGASDARALCPCAELGAASGHGASDHPTSLDALFGGGDDVDAGREDCQRPKKRMLGAMQPLLLGDSAFPTHAPLALVRIDDTWLAFVPAEMTAQAGASLTRRVREAVKTGDGRPAHAVVAGLANGYLQYVTTRREYEVQKYEGASTLYGPAMAEYFEQRFLLLARSMTGEPVVLPEGEPRLGEATPWAYRAPPSRARFPRLEDEPAVVTEQGRRRQRGLCTIPGPAPASVCFWWSDGGPAHVLLGKNRWMALAPADGGAPVRTCNAQRPLRSPWQSVCDPGAVIDDRGLDFQTRVRSREGDLWVWSSVLRLSEEEWTSLAGPQGVRFQALGSDGAAPVESAPFTRRKMPEPCPDEIVRFCLGDAGPEPR